MPKPVTIGESGYRKNHVEQLLSGWSQNLNEGDDDNGYKPLNDSYYAEVASALVQSVGTEQILQQMIAMRSSIVDQNELAKFNYNLSMLMTELLKANPNDSALKAIGDHVLNQTDPIPAEHSETLEHFEQLFPSKAGSAGVNFQNIFVPTVRELKKQVGNASRIQSNRESAMGVVPTGNEAFKQAMQNTKLSVDSTQLVEEAKKTASDLLAMGVSILNEVQANDFLAQKIPNIVANVNQISNMIVDDIVLSKSLIEQKNTYYFYVRVMHECIENRNFHAAQAILSGLENSAVSRLKYLREDPKVNKMHTDIDLLLQKESSNKNYRDRVKSSDKPYIPMFPVALGDLTFINDGNPATIDTKSSLGKVENLNRLKMFGEQAHTIQTLQKKYQTHPVTSFQTDIKSRIESPHLRERDSYALSLAIAPRPAEGQKIVPFQNQEGITIARNEALANLPAAAVAPSAPLPEVTPPPVPEAATQAAPQQPAAAPVVTTPPPAPPVPDAAAQAPQQPQAAAPVVAGPPSLPPRSKMNTTILPAPPPLEPPPLLPEKLSSPIAASSVPTAPKDALPPNIDALKTKLSQIVAFAVLGSQDPLVVQAKSCLKEIDQIKNSPEPSTAKSQQYSDLLDKIKNDNNIDIYIRKLVDPNVTAQSKATAAAPQKPAASKKPPLLLRAFMKSNKEKTPKLTELASKTTVAREADVDADRKPTNKGRGRR